MILEWPWESGVVCHVNGSCIQICPFMSPKFPSVRSSQQSAHCASSQCPAILLMCDSAKVLKSTKHGRNLFWGAEIWSPDMTFFPAYDALSLDFLVITLFLDIPLNPLQRRCEQWSVLSKKPTMCTMCQWYSGSKSWRRLKVAGNWLTGITTSKWPNFWTPYGLPYRPCRFPNSWLLLVATYLLHLVTCLSWWPWLDAEKLWWSWSCRCPG